MFKLVFAFSHIYYICIYIYILNGLYLLNVDYILNINGTWGLYEYCGSQVSNSYWEGNYYLFIICTVVHYSWFNRILLSIDRMPGFQLTHLLILLCWISSLLAQAIILRKTSMNTVWHFVYLALTLSTGISTISVELPSTLGQISQLHYISSQIASILFLMLADLERISSHLQDQNLICLFVLSIWGSQQWLQFFHE